MLFGTAHRKHAVADIRWYPAERDMDGAGPDDAAGTASRDGSRKSYDAFISYAHDADGAFAPVLQRGLQPAPNWPF